MEMIATSLRSRRVIAIKSIPRLSLLLIVANPVLLPFPPVLFKALPGRSGFSPHKLEGEER